MRTRSARLLVLLLAFAAMLVAACGGSSDSTTDSSSSSSSSSSTAGDGDGAGAKLSLVGYSVAKTGFDKVIPAFQATAEGKGVTFSQSYGASGDQSRKVEAGLATDVAMFSLEPDMTRLVDAGLVDKDWNQNALKGMTAGSVVTIVVRKGNPKHIENWDDLIKSGIQVVTPNPFSSGSAKWNLIAPWAIYSDGGKNNQAGLDYLTKLVANVKGQPKSAREATELFLQGTGDALLSYENEAITNERSGADVEHIQLPDTLKIENPLAVLNNSKHLEQAKAFETFSESAAGQQQWVAAGFRPADPTIGAEVDSKAPFYTPKKLWTMAELGGWDKINTELFDPDTGSVAKIYDQATN